MVRIKKRSISKNLTISLSIVIAIISIIFASFYSFQITKSTKVQLDKTADEYINSLVSTLEVPLWDLDREDINAVCNYYLSNKLVINLQLTGQSGEVIFQQRKKTDSGKSELSQRKKDIIYNDELMGNVSITLSSALAEDTKVELMKSVIAALLISVIGIMIFTGFLLNKFLQEPLANLCQIASSYSQGDFHPQKVGESYQGHGRNAGYPAPPVQIPSMRNYRTGLLPQVKRRDVDLGMGVIPELWESTSSSAVAYVSR